MKLNVKRNMEKTKKGLNDLKAKVVLSPLFNRLAVPIVVIGAIVASGCTGTDGVDTVVNGIEGGVEPTAVGTDIPSGAGINAFNAVVPVGEQEALKETARLALENGDSSVRLTAWNGDVELGETLVQINPGDDLNTVMRDYAFKVSQMQAKLALAEANAVGTTPTATEAATATATATEAATATLTEAEVQKAVEATTTEALTNTFNAAVNRGDASVIVPTPTPTPDGLGIEIQNIKVNTTSVEGAMIDYSNKLDKIAVEQNALKR